MAIRPARGTVVAMHSERVEQVARHMTRLETRWAAATVPMSASSWSSMPADDDHHRFGYLTPGHAGTGVVVVFCPTVIAFRTRALDDAWFDDYLCTIETHLTLHAERDLDERGIHAEMERLAPDSWVIAQLVDADTRSAGGVSSMLMKTGPDVSSTVEP